MPLRRASIAEMRPMRRRAGQVELDEVLGSPICRSRVEKSARETARRLEGIMAPFICASRAKPTTFSVVDRPAPLTVTVSPTSAALIAR